MKIAIASDHGGFELKQKLIAHYAQNGMVFTDLGTHNTDSCDYPDMAKKMAETILSHSADFGILICGTGIGISIAANRYHGIRAAVLYDDFVAEMAKKHNNANVLVFGGRTMKQEDVIKRIDIFLNSEFEGGRHNKRLEKDLDGTRTELDTLRRNYILMASDLAELQANYQQIDAEYKSSISGKDALAEQLSLKEAELAEKEKLLNSQSEKLAELQSILDKKDQQLNSLRDAVGKALLGFRDKGLSIQMKNGKVYVSMDEKLLFASGSWTVNPQGREAIYELGNVMAQNPDIHILVEGHTDNVPLRGKGDIKDNWDLSAKRATSIVRLLLENKNIEPSRVSACGRSEYAPLVDNETPENRAKNRRTEIILTPDLDELFQVISKE